MTDYERSEAEYEQQQDFRSSGCRAAEKELDITLLSFVPKIAPLSLRTYMHTRKS